MKLTRINMTMLLQALILIIVIFLSILLLFHTCRHDPFGISGEQSPNSDLTELWPDDAAQKIMNSPKTFSLNSNKMDMLAQSILTIAIKANPNTTALELEEIVNASSCLVTCSTNTLAAFQIHYALTNDSKFQLYFVPVVFCEENGKYGQGGYYYSHETICYQSDKYYKYSADFSSFEIEEAVTATNNIKNYQSKLTVSRPENSGIATATFSNGTSIEGDVQSVFIPLSEILELCGHTVKMLIWNAAVNMTLIKRNQSGITYSKNYVKHTLILSSDEVEVNHNSTLNNYANAHFRDLSHLCPPSCNGDNFTFALRNVSPAIAAGSR